MITVDAELSISLDEEAGDLPFDINVTGAGSTLTVHISDPTRLPAGDRSRLQDLATFAGSLADEGARVQVVGPDGLIIEFGAVNAGMIGRIFSGSSHIRLGSPEVRRALGLRSSKKATLPIPPIAPMLRPLLPMIRRGSHSPVTTTHYARGAGRPRLIFTREADVWDGSPPGIFELTSDVILLGSAPSCDLVLPGLAEVHAEIRHDDDDEYVVFPREPIGGGAQDPALEATAGRVLRTGARLTIGKWRLAFFREEYADHGRPYGGRQGGELSQQRRQPPRNEIMGNRSDHRT
ncbi:MULTISPECIES: FHA domain-containing protein [Brevibacterium]|uniref:FHA domain-containing protein n=2 Tax=Brevibacterium antiquum TaxID=234835 RepID=A0A2H1KW58_9MICO|nr:MULTISPECIES: FHA domain-containing protein [Brevibacterium]SMX93366.1 hypothetical protein BANT10_02571 [Brevibacterium antiquum]SMY03784.1 hypothetical protein BANT918_02898 [Brevibacterium antiquum CNRZ 918]